jgi:hypothetical protein
VRARVAELADALDLGSSGLNRRSSNLLSRTNNQDLAKSINKESSIVSEANMAVKVEEISPVKKKLS